MGELPHNFRDPTLLALALTHASADGQRNNERLEFLGDAVLDLIVAEELFQHLPQRSEGELTELKATVVSRPTLASAAAELGLEERATIGQGMRERALPRSVLANLYEAVLGAIYLDGGLEAARSFARASLAQPLARAHRPERGRNEKQVLQERVQLATGAPPTYVLLRERGHAHAKAFLISAEVGGRRFPAAWGRTRKEAERWAAHEALLVLEAEGARAAGGGTTS
jgi:ribonuclease-3